MAWRPKTVFGKIIKGAVVAGGSVLGLAAGVGLVGKIAGGVAKVATASSGTGILAKIGGVAGGIRNTTDRLKESAANLITGFTQEQRELINKAKEDARTELQKLEVVDKLTATGMDVSTARAQAGLSPEQLVEYKGEPVQSAGIASFLQSKTALYAIGALAALFILPKILKK